uniref:Reverse transcriptase domain-containing protein n=1 Tax=Musa acuminata subsp. malaccensis TaxID=214687 RepID=A0A804HN73_MUSAM
MNGIQQGDPFSPYLFTIVMEGFSYMLEEAISNGNIKNDSTLVRNVSTILKDFDIVSSLRSNHAKSKVYMGPYITNKDFIIDTLG